MATFGPSGVASHQTVRFRDLPLASLAFASERAVVGGGHGFNPLLFVSNGTTITSLAFATR